MTSLLCTVFNKLNLTGNTTNFIRLQKFLGFSKSVWQVERLIDLGAILLVWVNGVKPFCCFWFCGWTAKCKCLETLIWIHSWNKNLRTWFKSATKWSVCILEWAYTECLCHPMFKTTNLQYWSVRMSEQIYMYVQTTGIFSHHYFAQLCY